MGLLDRLLIMPALLVPWQISQPLPLFVTYSNFGVVQTTVHRSKDTFNLIEVLLVRGLPIQLTTWVVRNM